MMFPVLLQHLLDVTPPVRFEYINLKAIPPERFSVNNLEYPRSKANSFGLKVLARFPNSSVNGTSPSDE